MSSETTTYDFWATRFTQISLREISLHPTVDAIVSGFIQRPDPIGWAHAELVGQIEDAVRMNAADRASLHGGVHWPTAC
jgi:hypothetical protein